MSPHREPIPPGQPEPGEPDSGDLPPTGIPEDDEHSQPEVPT